MKTLGLVMALGLTMLTAVLPAWGQAIPATAVAALQQRYNESFANPAELVSGPEYIDKTLRYHHREGFPYFLLPDPQMGSVVYHNHAFGNQQLAYNVLLDQVVLRFPGSPFQFRLVNENVSAFTFGSHQFVRLVADSTSGSVIRTGFYEVLAEGNAQLLARRAKRLQEKKGLEFIDAELIPTDKLFIKKAGHYSLINSKKALLRVLADHAKEAQKYGQAQKLKFNKAHLEASTLALVRYYNSLPQQ